MARVRMDDLWLRRLKPTEKRVEYVDQETRGLSLQVTPSGKRSWFYRYRSGGGVQRRLALGTYPEVSLKAARDLAGENRTDVSRGEDPQAEKRAARVALTVIGLIDAYLAAAGPRGASSRREVERVLRGKDVAVLHSLPVAEVRRADLKLLLERIAGRGSLVMANRTRAWLSRLFAYAVELELVEYNPVAAIRPAVKERPRDRALSDTELAALWAAWEADGTVAARALQVMLLTGQREGEVLSVRWRDLDLQAAIWTIPAAIAKNRREHRVHLAPAVLAILEGLRPLAAGGYVFPSPRRSGFLASPRRAVERSSRKAGVTDWHPHDLRRTAATGMVNLGVAEVIVSRVLNHSPRGVTAAVYIRAQYGRELREAWDGWAAHVLTLGAASEARRAPRSASTGDMPARA